MVDQLHLGIARADIIPPLGIPLVGFAGRGPASAYRDPLTATALAAQCGLVKGVWIGLDLLQLQAATVSQFRRAIQAATGVPPFAIALSCSHTHYGPSIDRGEEGVIATYRTHLEYVLAGLARQAWDALQPGRLGVGWGETGIGINRREQKLDGRMVLGQNPDGSVDRQVGVARLEDESGAPLATLVNAACHPVSQGSRMQRLSADFPGAMRQVVEQLTGVPCLFIQGACGDVNPIRMEDAYEPARSLGVRLGCQAVEVWETIATEPAAGLAVWHKGIELPRYRYGSAATATALRDELSAQIGRMEEDEGASAGSLWWARHRRDGVVEALASWEQDKPLESVGAEVQTWRLGELGLATAPGEIFADNGLAVKGQSPFADTFFAAYTNGSIGYVPTRSAYPLGGYEVTHACRVDPGADEMLNSAALEGLQTVH
ncbi:MAG: hypothetical protein GKR89_12955 [Candidatus Latescibacteria bacterium]|nr:hypothetical protein [Candidatus Latescibacterota bacterium]